MNDSDLITVKDFSREVGISQQAVYQRLNKSLKEFVVVVNGKKFLKKAALLEFKSQQEQSKVEQQQANVEQDLIKTLQKTISMLEVQLEAKDKQIEELNERLKDAMEISKAHVVLSVAERQPVQTAIEQAPQGVPNESPDFWTRLKNIFR